MDLAKLVVRLEAQSAQLLTELEKANKKIDRFASSTSDTLKTWAAGLVAVFTVDAIASFANSAIDAAAHLNDLATETNLSVEKLSGLGYAASQSGSSLDEMAGALQKLAVKAADAVGGNDAAKASFDTLGVSVTNADGTLKSIDEILLGVADGFAKHADGVAEAALAQDLFGKSGQKFLAMLNLGRDGIEALTDKARKLGLIMSGETAAAADQFKNDLSTLSQVLSKNLSAALLKVLPQLIQLTNAIIALLATENGVKSWTGTVINGFTRILKIGYATSLTFGDLGRGIGAFAAYVDKVFTLDFAGARAIQKELDADLAASDAAYLKFIKDLEGTGPQPLAALSDMAQALETVVVTAKKLAEVEEIKITVAKIKTDPLDAFYAELNERTRTQNERQVAAYDADLMALQELLAEKLISSQTYNERLAEIQDTFLPEFEVTLKKVSEVAEKAVVELSEFQEQAARNTQDIIADTFVGLATGADISAKSILKSFGQMIIQLAAQAAAANLAGKLFGEAGGGTKGSTGWIGLALGALGAGGTRDRGGRGMPGMEYSIGTGAQPERFVPDRPGTFIPAGAGGTQVTNNFTVQTEQPVTRRTQMQVAAAASRGVARANRRNN